MKNSFKNIFIGVVALSIIVMASCGKDDIASPTSGRMRFFNALTDVPTATSAAGVDLLIDNAPVNLRNPLGGAALIDSSFRLGAGFPANTDSSYLFLTEGTHSIKINSPAGSPAGGTTTALTKDVTIAAGKTYLAFAIDSLAKADLLVIENILPSPKTGKAFVRVLHLSPDAPAVDAMARFVKTSTANVVTYLDSTSVATNTVYKGLTEFVEVKAPDSLIIEFRPTGTTKAATTLSKISLTAGRCYTIIPRGLLAKKTLGVASIVHGR
jgi:hypothetical protein